MLLSKFDTLCVKKFYIFLWIKIKNANATLIYLFFIRKMILY